MPTARPGKRSGAFTLIELLTVIAIIGILAAILIPVVSSVREKARGAVCQTNLRNIGMAMFLYAEDNHGRLPPFAPDGGQWWLQGLMGQTPTGIRVGPNYLDEHWDDTEKRANNLICPQSVAHYPTINGIGYGMNIPAGAHTTSRRLDDLRAPTIFVLVADATVLVGPNWYDSALGPHAGSIYPNTTHGGGANYLFADGHVGYVKAEKPGEINSPPIGLNETIFFTEQN